MSLEISDNHGGVIKINDCFSEVCQCFELNNEHTTMEIPYAELPGVIEFLSTRLPEKKEDDEVTTLKAEVESLKSEIRGLVKNIQLATLALRPV